MTDFTLCKACGQRPIQYRYGYEIDGMCRLCWAQSTGDTPEDLAELDAHNEEEYKVLVEQYREELMADPTLAAYYRTKAGS